MCAQYIPINSYPSHLLTCLQANSFGQDNVFSSNEQLFTDFFALGSHPSRNLRATIAQFFNSVDASSAQYSSPERQFESSFNAIDPIDAGEIAPFVIFQVSAMAIPAMFQNEYNFNTMLEDMIGNVEIGLTEDEIERVSILVPFNVYGEEVCSICLDKLEESQRNARRLMCNHVYCDECIKTWWKKSKKCPCCKVDLKDTYANSD